MEEADFKRLLELNAAETRAHFDAVAGQLREELRQEIALSAGGLRQEIASSAGGLRQEIASSAGGLRQEIASSAGGLRQEIAAVRQEMRGQFELMTERLESRIELVAEGVAMVNEKLDRETADIRGEMRHGFAETHDLIRFAYRDLERRSR